MARGTRPTRICPHPNRPVIMTSIFHSPIPMNHVASPGKNKNATVRYFRRCPGGLAEEADRLAALGPARTFLRWHHYLL